MIIDTETKHIGITGTRNGGTTAQLMSLAAFFAGLQTSGIEVKVHHGVCVGVDEEAAELAKSAGFFVIDHPPSNSRLKSRFRGDYTHEPAPYHKRNEVIVLSSDILVAVPKEDHDMPFGGTWNSVAHARAHRVPTFIIWPNGQGEWREHD